MPNIRRITIEHTQTEIMTCYMAPRSCGHRDTLLMTPFTGLNIMNWFGQTFFNIICLIEMGMNEV